MKVTVLVLGLMQPSDHEHEAEAAPPFFFFGEEAISQDKCGISCFAELKTKNYLSTKAGKL
jgi:hypothetical protein